MGKGVKVVDGVGDGAGVGKGLDVDVGVALGVGVEEVVGVGVGDGVPQEYPELVNVCEYVHVAHIPLLSQVPPTQVWPQAAYVQSLSVVHAGVGVPVGAGQSAKHQPSSPASHVASPQLGEGVGLMVGATQSTGHELASSAGPSHVPSPQKLGFPVGLGVGVEQYGTEGEGDGEGPQSEGQTRLSSKLQ